MSQNTQVLLCQLANSEKVHQLSASEFLTDNEFCYPPFVNCLWSSHPRQFLKLDDKGSVLCPYCSTLYTLAYNK